MPIIRFDRTNSPIRRQAVWTWTAALLPLLLTWKSCWRKSRHTGVPWTLTALSAAPFLRATTGKTETAAALPHCCECVFCVSLRCWPSSNFSRFCANMFVLSTEIAVQKCRANYFVLKLRAATRTTLILQPAIRARTGPSPFSHVDTARHQRGGAA